MHVYLHLEEKLITADGSLTLFAYIVFTGESTLNVVAVHSTLHLPYDHRMYGQNLTVQVKIWAPYCLSSFILAEVAMSGGYMHYQTINPVTIY